MDLLACPGFDFSGIETFFNVAALVVGVPMMIGTAGIILIFATAER